MRRLFIAFLVLGAGAVAAQVARGSNASVDTTGPNGGFGAFDSRDPSTALAVMHNGIGVRYIVQDCATVASIVGGLTGPSAFCLEPDGTSYAGTQVDGGPLLTLAAVGSPVTETRAVCPNGANCASTASQRASPSADGGTSYWQTASNTGPAGSYTVGCVASSDVAATAGTLFGRWVPTTSIELVFASSAAALYHNDGVASTSASSGGITSNARHFVSATYTHVGAGAVNGATVYLDGVAGTPSTTMRPAQSVSEVAVLAGTAGPLGLVGRIGPCFLTEATLTAAQHLALAQATLSSWAGSYGETITFTRATAHSCTAEDGTLTVLPPGRPCITRGAVKMRPAVTNRLTQSETLNAWTARGTASAVANQFTAPDLTATGDAVTVGLVGVDDVYMSTAGGGASAANTPAIWLTGVDAGGTLDIQNVQGAGLGRIKVPLDLLPYDGGWLRVYPGLAGTTTVAAFVNTGAGAAGVHFYSEDAGTIVFGAWGGQVNDGALADYCGPTVASAVTCAIEAGSVTTPATLSRTEGCARACFTPAFSGAPTQALSLVTDGNVISTARFLYFLSGEQKWRAYNGVVAPNVATTWTTDVKSCARASWSATRNTLTVEDETTGATNTTAFTTFGVYAASLGIGADGSGSNAANGYISDVVFGTHPDGCR